MSPQVKLFMAVLLRAHLVESRAGIEESEHSVDRARLDKLETDIEQLVSIAIGYAEQIAPAPLA